MLQWTDEAMRSLRLYLTKKAGSVEKRVEVLLQANASTRINTGKPVEAPTGYRRLLAVSP